MTTFQQAVIHAVLAGLAIVAALVLAILTKIDATVALGIILAAAGIGGTGVAGAVSSSAPAPAQPVASSAPVKALTPPVTS